MTLSIPTTLIAPCGMNCILCRAYTRKNNTCPDCRGDDKVKSRISIRSGIKEYGVLFQGKRNNGPAPNAADCSVSIHRDASIVSTHGDRTYWPALASSLTSLGLHTSSSPPARYGAGNRASCRVFHSEKPVAGQLPSRLRSQALRISETGSGTSASAATRSHSPRPRGTV